MSEVAEWDAVADEVLAAVQGRVEGLVRKASDDFYYDLLHTVQDYLCENAAFNIRSRVESAERQALADRLALQEQRATSDALLGALKAAHHALTVTHNLRATDLSPDAFEHQSASVRREDLEWMIDHSAELAAVEAAISRAEGR